MCLVLESLGFGRTGCDFAIDLGVSTYVGMRVQTAPCVECDQQVASMWEYECLDSYM